jgi:dihydroorotate dehydrogenase electron transfer subunit
VSKIIQKKAKIISNINLTSNYYKLSLELPEFARIARPGQFLMIRVNQDYNPFIRRPFSIHSVSLKSKAAESSIAILYEAVGVGTELLSKKKTGQYLDVLGPLGNGFSILDARFSILVGGGIGIAPLLFLAEQASIQYPASSIQVLIGANTKREILCQKKFAKLGFSVKISTNDGSTGFRGNVTELLRRILLTTHNSQLTTIYACGPKSMLREISLISQQNSIPAQVSLDEYMACGLGVCMGCMIKTKKAHRFVCRDGPVFDASEISWYNK